MNTGTFCLLLLMIYAARDLPKLCEGNTKQKDDCDDEAAKTAIKDDQKNASVGDIVQYNATKKNNCVTNDESNNTKTGVSASESEVKSKYDDTKKVDPGLNGVNTVPMREDKDKQKDNDTNKTVPLSDKSAPASDREDSGMPTVPPARGHSSRDKSAPASDREDSGMPIVPPARGHSSIDKSGMPITIPAGNGEDREKQKGPPVPDSEHGDIPNRAPLRPHEGRDTYTQETPAANLSAPETTGNGTDGNNNASYPLHKMSGDRVTVDDVEEIKLRNSKAVGVLADVVAATAVGFLAYLLLT